MNFTVKPPLSRDCTAGVRIAAHDKADHQSTSFFHKLVLETLGRNIDRLIKYSRGEILLLGPERRIVEKVLTMAEGRFELEWTHPFNPGASTHVSLFEGGKGPLYIVASGHGSGEVEALVDLLKTLRDRNESAAAIAFVSEEYRALRAQASSRPRS